MTQIRSSTGTFVIKVLTSIDILTQNRTDKLTHAVDLKTLTTLVCPSDQIILIPAELRPSVASDDSPAQIHSEISRRSTQ